ncbi:MAG TPA: hypothetical protein VD997_10455 [Phycisphaerales bacterium]|nr:hypothetical protein [Phycisphaerales bacterium]
MNHHLIEVRHTCLADPEHHYSTFITAPASTPVREVLADTAAHFRPWLGHSPTWTVQIIHRAQIAGTLGDTPLRETA